MRLKTFGFILLALLLTLFCVPVPASAMLPLPHAFYGDVTINGSLAPAGTTTIEARGDGVLTGIEGNPVTTTALGKYGSTTSPELDLIVQGDLTSGADISFFVNGIYSTTFNFKSGETSELDLAVEITPGSITGKVEETISPGQTGYVVDASDIANTTITVDTTGDVTITVKKYYSNPHPGASPPTGTDMLPRYIDIDVDNPDAIDWPMHVEQIYTDEDVVGLDEASLGMCYFTDEPVPDGAWLRCKNTGVWEDINTIWADLEKDELPGCPVAIGGTPPPAGVGGGGAGFIPPAGTTNVRGKVSNAGVFYSSVTATSEDRLCTLTIAKGTVGLTEELEPLEKITMVIMDKLPPAPERAHVIGLAYDFGPDGATFEPPITLTWSYDPTDIREGVAEGDLVIAYYAAGGWVELAGCVVDREANTITALVWHFTTFAIIGAPPPLPPTPAAISVTDLSVKPIEIEPEAAVTVTVSLANTGGSQGSYSVVLEIDGVKEAEKSITVAADSSRSVSFSVTREEAGSYSVAVDGLSASFTVVAPPVLKPPAPPSPPAPAPPVAPVPPEVKPVNWPIIGGIIGGVVVVGLLIFFLVRRRRAY